jgi:hypothetical protein
MMYEFPEYDFVVVRRPGWCCPDIRAADMLDAFRLCGMWPHRRHLVEDRGDRVRILDGGSSESGRDFVFLLNGEVHIPAYEAISIFEANARAATAADPREVSFRPWSRHRIRRPRPKLGNERRANGGVVSDEEMLEVGIGIRPSRTHRFDPWDEAVGRNQRNWKGFRKTRWKVCPGND